ncbi:phage baseplate assembly protein V [Chitinophaga sp. Ak27]|uniref:phage baseplate assembly protein V n=1 Tax=Chitinophaga sp. Ak27 TaxID=2726116 RepID=UPI00145CE7C1|nr:phage baseplate assembly protein V [Chitinophaga sp. Ak27]NLU93035.1 hypothetical protein [Chitinophaga sp. Ak27]
MSLYTQTFFRIGDVQFHSFYSLRLEQSIMQPHRLEITMGQEWIAHYHFDSTQQLIGKEITLSIGGIAETASTDMLSFNGIITCVHIGKGIAGAHGYCRIIAHSPDFLLEDDPHTTTFTLQSLDSIIATCLKRLQPYGGAFLIQSRNSQALKYIVQYKETTGQFVKRMAARFGEWYFYNGQQLIFGQYTPRKTILVHRHNLVDFNISLQTTAGNSSLQHYAYTPGQILASNAGAVPLSNSNGYTTHVKTVSNELYRNSSLYKMNYGFTENTQEELDKIAAVQHQGQLSQMVVLRGCSKVPFLRIGDKVSIQEQLPATTTHGDFIITSLLHTCTAHGMYSNQFEAIPADLVGPATDIHSHPRCESQSAVVTDNNDPENLGRVRVRFRWQQEGSTPWLRIITPHAGTGKGIYLVPEINEEVWVGFEDGHPENPYVLGAAWNGTAHSAFGSQRNNIKALKTRGGHLIRLDDTDGQESITITDKNGNIIFLDTPARSIMITAAEAIDWSARNITFHIANALTINSGNQLLMNTGGRMLVYSPLFQQMVPGFMYLFSEKTLLQSRDEIRVESPEIYAAGKEKMFLYSEQQTVLNSQGTNFIKGATASKHTNSPDSYQVADDELMVACVVQFRPQNSWKGEYGFDWFRQSDTSISGDVDYEDIVGKYYTSAAYTDIVTDRNAWSKFFRKEAADLEQLKLLYTPFHYALKKDKDNRAVVLRYYAPWIALLPSGQPGAAEVELKLLIDYQDKPARIEFEYNEAHLSLDKKTITDIHKKDTLKVSSRMVFPRDEEINVYAYAKPDDTRDKRKLVGKLHVVGSGKTRQVNVVIVRVLTRVRRAVKQGVPIRGGLDDFQRSLRQALIQLNITDQANDANGVPAVITLDVTEPGLNFAANYAPNGNYLRPVRADLGEFLNRQFDQSRYGTLFPDHYRLFFLGDSATENTADAGGNQQTRSKQGFSQLNVNWGVFFATHDKPTIAHEMLHALGLPHSFDSQARFCYEAQKTENILDYSNWNVDIDGNAHTPINRISTWYWQWQVLNNQI